MKLSRKISGSKPIILYEPFFEPYSLLLGHLPYKFVLYNHPQSRKWNYNYGPPPSNHITINTITPNLVPDILICQSHQNIDFYRKLQSKFNCDIIGVEYDIPKTNEHEVYYDEMTTYVYFSQKHRDIWWGPSSVSKIIPFGAQIAEKAENKLYISKSNSFISMCDVINNMAKGNCVVAEAALEIPDIIEHFKDGILFNNESTKKQIIEKLKTNQDIINIIGKSAIQKVRAKFSIEQFKSKWIELINECTTKN